MFLESEGTSWTAAQQLAARVRPWAAKQLLDWLGQEELLEVGNLAA